MNKCIFLGNFVADPETRYSQNGDMTITRFRLAVQRKYKREGEPDADFLNYVAFGKTAELIGKYFAQGSKILVETHAQTGSYEKDGRKVYTTDYVVEGFDFVGVKADKTERAEPAKDGEFVPVPEKGVDDLPWD